MYKESFFYVVLTLNLVKWKMCM